jgi:hypothetical protein
MMWISVGTIHKASRAFKIQTSGHQSSWFGRASYIYGNCVHQINRPEDHSYGPDVRSLNMEIVCSEGATVRTTGQHHPDEAQIRKEFQRNFGKSMHSCPFKGLLGFSSQTLI